MGKHSRKEKTPVNWAAVVTSIVAVAGVVHRVVRKLRAR